ncbi:MAG: alpha-E domain-containing protein [Myxococcaceae bacterium]|nr:MAG: alpha-E domain-containing protein [Myxococcaceae bacterium]
MLSRVADSIYWLNRYTERAENVARFVDVHLHLQLDAAFGVDEQWAPILTTTGDRAAFDARYPTPTRENVLRFLSFDEANPNSIVSCLRAARENARAVREIVSSEMWEQVNRAYLMVRDAAATDALESPHEFYTAVKNASQLFVGVSYLTMTHNEAWHFGRLGRLIERADKTSRILDVKYFLLLPTAQDVGMAYDDIQWGALLKSASAFEMYRKKHGLLAPAKVVDFLLLERQFPRAIRYCVVKAERSVHAISGTALDAAASPAERALGGLRATLEASDTRDIIGGGLHEYLDAFQTRLNAASDAVHETFFALRPVAPTEPASQSQSQG